MRDTHSTTILPHCILHPPNKHKLCTSADQKAFFNFIKCTKILATRSRYVLFSIFESTYFVFIPPTASTHACCMCQHPPRLPLASIRSHTLPHPYQRDIHNQTLAVLAHQVQQQLFIHHSQTLAPPTGPGDNYSFITQTLVPPGGPTDNYSFITQTLVPPGGPTDNYSFITQTLVPPGGPTDNYSFITQTLVPPGGPSANYSFDY